LSFSLPLLLVVVVVGEEEEEIECVLREERERAEG
jgi:hypothetical protein